MNKPSTNDVLTKNQLPFIDGDGKFVGDKLVSINILTYNGQELIEECLKSVLRQTYKNVEILIIDNASTDDTISRIMNYKSKIKKRFPFKVIKNKKNLGFTGGHNIGIRKCKGDYILCLNQDVFLDENFVKYAVEVIEEDKKIGAVQGKLYKIQKAQPPQAYPKFKIQTILDSTGLLMFKNRRIVDRGAGERDENQYKAGEIFGANGAAPLYRRKALEDIKLPICLNPRSYPPKSASRKYEYFDEDFFMYKEDIDLAWRLRLYAWKAIYEPKAVAYHLRGAGEKAVRNYISVARERRKLSKFAKFYSFKNQRLMQIKNELPALFFSHIFYILIKEIGAWLYVLFFEHYTWKAIKELAKQVPRAWRKRKIIMKNRKVSSKQMARWFV